MATPSEPAYIPLSPHWDEKAYAEDALPAASGRDARAPVLRRRPAGRSMLSAARRLLRTHALRLAALYFLVFAASVLGVLLFVYWTSADFVERQTEATLDAEITGLAEQYAQRGLSGLIQIVAARSAGDRGDGMLYLVADPDGKPLVGNIADWPSGAKPTSGSVSFSVAVKVKGRTETHPARGMLIVTPQNYRLLVGRDISDAATFRDRIKSTLLWSGLVALGVGLIGGSVMSRNMLRRVEQVNRTAERVIAGHLSDRVPLKGTSDEFDQLAVNLNGMLDQIERLMTGLREVTDNVAHDLKTPLSRLRARLELTLLAPAGDAAQSEAIQSEAIRAAIDEADRLLATFNALLSITEAESGTIRNRAEPLDLGELARGRCRALRAGGRGTGLRAAPRQRAGGDDPRRPPSAIAGGRQPARQRIEIRRQRGGSRRDRPVRRAAGRTRRARSVGLRPRHPRAGPRQRVRPLRPAGTEPQHAGQRARSQPRAGRCPIARGRGQPAR